MTSVTSNLRVLRAIFVKDLKHAVRYPGQVAMIFILPYFFTIMISAMGNFIGGEDSALYFAQKTGTTNFFMYQILGGAMWILSWVVIDRIGTSLRDERIKGTLEQTYLAPINRFLLLISMALVNIITSSLTFFGVIVVSAVIFDSASAIGLLQAFSVLAIGLVPLFGIGFIFAGLVVRFKEPYAFVNIVNLLFSILIGTYYPVTILPYWVQLISRTLPQTYVIEDMRLILLANKTLVDLYGHYIILSAMAIVYPLIGYYIFKMFLNRARVTGDLSKY